ncbi:hypothetical protein Agabi119p4_11010 [Agaricus bisporus var. burnettii]|uniref:Protein kinase domain-containing protein n=1 Tax=Agaricus bisporus var. burnettii TaxID=192524 RepID=A0A8H7BZZ2_AGABI|nr:hypothetical protein Agabi119p4_11010 [Agaricus bisporus var. burnettii]
MDTTIPITFPFPLQDNEHEDIFERIAFWDSHLTREWFLQRGYTLYTHRHPDDHPWYSEPTLKCKDSCEMEYPYSHYESKGNTKTPLRARDVQGKIAYGQETRNSSHHVAIKLIMTDSEEHRILQFLQSQGTKVLKDNCLVPVLDILLNGPFSFVVMPRWSACIDLPEGGPIKNVIRIVHSLLKALSFLHRNNILHRDIKLENVLVSHFADDTDDYVSNSVRKQLQWSDQLSYCLFDFDISMMLPEDTDRARCRLPYKLSWHGSGWQPNDTLQGEFDYNPFAYDVGTLGRVLCLTYPHLIPRIPMFAPFLDKMVTRNVALRFSAEEALAFFEKILPEIPEEVMNIECPEYQGVSDYETDRWEGLAPEFIKKWENYREPPIPFVTTVLRRLCSFDRMRYIVSAVRLFFFRISLVPVQIGLFPQ